MRRTKIICTIGPATSSEQQLEALMRAGMNVARINFSHGTHDEHAVTIERIRAISSRIGYPVAILQDLQGPKIRVGALPGGQPIKLINGTEVTITTEQATDNDHLIPTTYKHLAEDVKAGDRILLDDGSMELRVIDAGATDVRARVIHGGLLKEHKGINLPGVAVSTPALSEKDRDDLRFGIEHNVDYVALSFVRKADDVIETKKLMRQFQDELSTTAAQATTDIPLIVKLEKPEAVAHLEDILSVADGIMVARGDLGVEMSLEQVPMIQKRVIARCNQLGLPVITATQMLESMITNPTPTRAEVNDVSNAILDGTDAIMLSAETAAGDYPIAAVEMMVRIANATEAGGQTARQPQCQQLTQEHAVSHAARALSEEASVVAIVVFTRTGTTARLISKDRPRTSILAYTPSARVYRQLTLWWGVWPYFVDMHESTQELINVVDQRLQDDHLIEKGEHVVLMGGIPLAHRARTNFVKLHRVGDE